MRVVAILALLSLSSCNRPSEPEALPPAPAPPSIPTLVSTPGSVAGIVRLTGRLPSDIIDGSMYGGGKPIEPAKVKKSVVLGEGQTLANVYVAVKSGLGRSVSPPSASPVVLRLIDFMYEPRVIGLLTRQTLRVKTEDDEVHNPNLPRKFGVGHSPRLEEDFTFDKPEVGISVRCDVHPWEHAWIHVADHPFFDVTTVDGRFAIDGLAPGDYEIMAWHERFRDRPLVSKVTVKEGQPATLDFTFEAPKK